MLFFQYFATQLLTDHWDPTLIWYDILRQSMKIPHRRAMFWREWTHVHPLQQPSFSYFVLFTYELASKRLGYIMASQSTWTLRTLFQSQPGIYSSQPLHHGGRDWPSQRQHWPRLTRRSRNDNLGGFVMIVMSMLLATIDVGMIFPFVAHDEFAWYSCRA